jgi:hypothetical protein
MQWYITALIIVCVLCAAWYLLVFSGKWIKVFKVDLPKKFDSGNLTLTICLQVVSSALIGLAFFLIAPFSGWLALFILIAFCAWQTASLKLRYSDFKEFNCAATIEAGYTFLAGITFILFGMLG